MITIHKILFNFLSQDEAFTRRLYGEWDSFSRTAVEEVADDVLEKYDSPTEAITLERLELDLGTLTEPEFYEKFPKLFAEKLQESLEEQLKYKEKYGVKVSSTTSTLVEHLHFYLLHGYPRWDHTFQSFQPDKLFRELLKEEPDKISQLLQEVKHLAYVRQRIIYLLKDKDIEQIIRLTDPENAPFITRYSHFLIHSYQASQRQEISQSNYRHIVWSVILAYLWSNSRGHFSRKELIRQTIVQLSSHYGLKPELLLNLLVTEIRHLPTDLVMQELTRILHELWNESKEKEPESHHIPKDVIIQNKTQLQPDIKSIHQPTKKIDMEDSIDNQTHPLPVHNVGLVLFSPWLPRLFQMRELIENNRFKGRESQVKGIFLLQALAGYTSGEEVKESELLLNKLLVGLPLSEPVPLRYELTLEEESIINSLINAVKQNWSKIKNTSIEGFRDSFINRQGTLIEKENTWEITVEQKGYDILLDFLPWSYRLIRFPWNSKPIATVWR